MVIPELIRLLTARGIELDETISIVRSMTATTNHTILAEALEKWPLEFLQEVVPHGTNHRRIGPSRESRIQKIQLFKLSMRWACSLAPMDIHYGYSVNGVAALPH